MARKTHGGIADVFNFSGLTATGTRLSAADNTDITVDPTGTGEFKIDGNQLMLAQSDLRFGDADSSNWVAFQAPSTIASDVTWTLPDADATTANQSLVSDASGTLSWVTTGAQITDDTTDSTPEYIIFGNATTGTLLDVSVSSSKLTYTPSTGEIAADAGNFSGTVKQLHVENTYTTDHTLVSADQSRVVHMNNASNASITVPPNSDVAFPLGSIVWLYRNPGAAGRVSLVAGAGVTLKKTGNLAAGEELYIRKRDTNYWNVVDVPEALLASGGTESQAGGYQIHTYTGAGSYSFVV